MSKCNENRPGYKKTKVEVEPDKEYREIGIRSHGKGIFHKNPTTGIQLGNKSVFWVKEPTLIFKFVRIANGVTRFGLTLESVKHI